MHASFFPQLEDLGGEVLVTPAQAAALELLEAILAGETTETTSEHAPSRQGRRCRRDL